MERIRFKEFEGKRFPYIDMGSESHGRTSFRLWLAGAVVKEKAIHKDDGLYLQFPLPGTIITRTQKGNWVLRLSPDHTTFDIYVRCGYRGGADFEILRPTPVEVLTYKEYHSPRGSLGVSKGALVSVEGHEIIYRWERSGRLYGSPARGVTRLTSDGGKEDMDMLPDGLEAVEELEPLEED